MKVHAFKVVQIADLSLRDVIQHINGLPLADRLRNIEGVDMRLEDANLNGPVWFLDFSSIRHEGPGRASPDAPIIDFDLEDHEGFGQETAACFDTGPANGLVLQYNHYGPRAPRIQTYLFRFAADVAGRPVGVDADGYGVMFTPVIKAEAAERLRQMDIIKSIDISVFVPGLLAHSPPQRQAALGSILNDPLVGSADTMKLQLSVSRTRGRTLSVDNVLQYVQGLIGLRDDVNKLEIRAMETEDASREPLDLLQARLEADVPVVRDGRRYSRADRWSVLRRSYDIWLANGYFA